MKQRILILMTIVLNVSCLVSAQDNTKNRIKDLLIIMHQDSFSIKKFEDLSRPSSTNYSEYFNDSTTLKVLSTLITDTSLLNDMKTIMKDTGYMSMTGAIKDIYLLKQKVNSEAIKKLAIKFTNEDLIEIYSTKFSIDEIEEMIKFYQTSTGQKLLSLIPEIEKDINRRIEEKYATYLQGL